MSHYLPEKSNNVDNDFVKQLGIIKTLTNSFSCSTM